MKQYSVLSVDKIVADEFGDVKGNFAKQDGTILYHLVRWFTPTGTFSSIGTAVTTTGGQLTANMVGAKIGVGTDRRIITAFLTSNTCTVDSAFSSNYVSEPLANWGVYSKAYENSAGLQIFYATDGNNRTQIGTNGVISAANIVQRFNRGSFGDGALSGHNAYVFNWSNSGGHDGTKDLGIRRNSAGVLEIFDGVTNGAFRDLGLRNLTATGSITATNLSGTNTGDQNENNIYLSNDFFAANNAEFLNFVALSGGTLATGTATPNNQGVIRIGSSTNANSGFSIRIPANTVRIKGGEVFTFIFNPLNFTNTTSRLGIHDSTSSADANNGIYFEYSGSGVLTLRTADNGTRTTSATIATLTISTWYKVRFTVNSNATSVLAELFNASGVLIASVTHTTTIPNNTRAVAVAANITNSGTTATNLVDADFVSARLTLTR